jgi:hypothetical protein
MGIDHAFIGFLLGVGSAGYAVGKLGAGVIADRYSCTAST